MTAPIQLQSYVAGRFVGSRPGAALASAVDGRPVAHAHEDALDFGELLVDERQHALLENVAGRVGDTQE